MPMVFVLYLHFVQYRVDGYLFEPAIWRQGMVFGRQQVEDLLARPDAPFFVIRFAALFDPACPCLSAAHGFGFSDRFGDKFAVACLFVDDDQVFWLKGILSADTAFAVCEPGGKRGEFLFVLFVPGRLFVGVGVKSREQGKF